MNKFEKLRPEEYILGVMMIIIFLSMAVNIICRYIFNTSLVFVEEVTTFLFGCTCFIGAPVACIRGLNIGMDAIIIFIPKKAQKFFVWWVLFFSAGLYIILLYQGIDLIINQIGSKLATPAMQTPVWMYSLAVPAGAALYLFRGVQYARKCHRELGADKPAAAERSE